MKLLLEHDEIIARWVAAQIPHMGDDFGPCAAMGVVAEDGTLLSGVVFHEYRERCRSIEVSFAAVSNRCLTQSVIRSIFAYPFDQLQCERVTAITPKRSRAPRKFLETFGFKREGLVRKGFGTDDAVIYGLLKREWLGSRWMQPRGARHG